MGTLFAIAAKLWSLLSGLLVTYSGFFVALPFLCIGALLLGALLVKIFPLLLVVARFLGSLAIFVCTCVALTLGIVLIVSDRITGYRLSPALAAIGIRLHVRPDQKSERASTKEDQERSRFEESERNYDSSREQKRSQQKEYQEHTYSDSYNDFHSYGGRREQEWDDDFEKLRKEWRRRQQQKSGQSNRKSSSQSGRSGHSKQSGSNKQQQGRSKERTQQSRSQHSNNTSSGSTAWSSPLDKAFNTLGVARGASAKVIRKRYLQLARKYHPDANRQLSEAARKSLEEKMKALNHAYDLIQQHQSGSKTAA